METPGNYMLVEHLYHMGPKEIKIKLNAPCIRPSCIECGDHKQYFRYTGYAALAYIIELEKTVGRARDHINELEEKIAKRDQLLATMGVRIREDENDKN